MIFTGTRSSPEMLLRKELWYDKSIQYRDDRNPKTMDQKTCAQKITTLMIGNLAYIA